MYTRLTIPPALPWKEDQLYAFSIPVKDGNFIVKGQPRETYDFTHLHANVWSIENRSNYDLSIVDLEKNPFDILFGEERSVWFELPPGMAYVTVNLQPHKIKTPYKFKLYENSTRTYSSSSEVVIKMIPIIVDSGEYDSHDFIVADYAYRNCLGEISSQPPALVLKFLVDQLYDRELKDV